MSCPLIFMERSRLIRERHGDQNMGEACVVAIAETSSAIAELVGDLTSSLKSVGDAFQVIFDGARRNSRMKLYGLPPQ